MYSEKGLFDKFPDKEELPAGWMGGHDRSIPEVNGHIHTPHSFSAFSDMEEAFKMAVAEGIKVLGINDFFTTDGYTEFARLAERYKVFPLFNIEFIALQRDLLNAGIRVNDPNNPGRTYLSGKGLDYPVRMSKKSIATIKTIQENSNNRSYRMVAKLNSLLAGIDSGLNLNANRLHKTYAKSLFLERHLAHAVRMTVFQKIGDKAGRKDMLKRMFSGKDIESSLDDSVALENEIRANLLKAGGPAFVDEDPETFLSLVDVMSLIKDAGGIPCYPVLLDDTAGNFTGYESDREKLFYSLIEKNIYCIELIPGRNDYQVLKDFVTWFHKKGFIIIFGTEHNTPQLLPLRITCRGGIRPDEKLRKISLEGAAVIAAHQYLRSLGEESLREGIYSEKNNRKEMVKLGMAVIAKFTER